MGVLVCLSMVSSRVFFAGVSGLSVILAPTVPYRGLDLREFLLHVAHPLQLPVWEITMDGRRATQMPGEYGPRSGLLWDRRGPND
jgi:hypothetical protein